MSGLLSMGLQDIIDYVVLGWENEMRQQIAESVGSYSEQFKPSYWKASLKDIFPK